MYVNYLIFFAQVAIKNSNHVDKKFLLKEQCTKNVCFRTHFLKAIQWYVLANLKLIVGLYSVVHSLVQHKT